MTFHRKTAADLRPSVGRDTDSWCSKCNMLLSHTITAMIGMEVVRVKCGTCGGEHKYKSTKDQVAATTATPRSSTPKSAGTRAAASPRATAVPATQAGKLMWERAMRDINRARAVAYTPQIQAVPGMLLDHKLFGYGIVQTVTEGKAHVLFEDGQKTLIMGRD